VPLLLQVETAPVRVSSLITPSATDDIAYRPFSVSGIDCATATLIPPRQKIAAGAKMNIEIENFEADVAVLMGLLRLKADKVFLIQRPYTRER
jgi:hypothetical protein